MPAKSTSNDEIHQVDKKRQIPLPTQLDCFVYLAHQGAQTSLPPAGVGILPRAASFTVNFPGSQPLRVEPLGDQCLTVHDFCRAGRPPKSSADDPVFHDNCSLNNHLLAQ
ncbi:hypothetical protein QC761_0047020 [Podospora bellae-mahoneyi]|uniref:Uncharacterized protein n=1 Tax=Podospora bellae-mahoneyi TaxID=2093777 RepID=A0ABR0FJB3_9PEZI|nr:hypothetical protein QC761_0047020 [Podospora bellae-mahoneyi]